MDSHQFCGLTAADFYFESPSPTTYTELTFDSPLSSHFEHGSFSNLSSSQEQHTPTEIISGSSTDHSLLDSESALQQRRVRLPGGIHLHSESLSAVSSQSMRDVLQKVETVLMEHDTAEPANGTNPEFNENKPPILIKRRSSSWNHETRLDSPASVQSHYLPVTQNNALNHELRPEKRPRFSKIVPGCNVKQLLVRCAQALYENKLEEYELSAEEIRNAVSINGEPIQRLGAYMLEGLVARHESSGTNIYRGLRYPQPKGKEFLSHMQSLYDICPCFKFGYMAANGAIADALKNEDRIHIVDFQIAQGAQWITLIQALAARPGGPPHVRITGINDPVADYAQGDGLQSARNMLSGMSKKFDVPIEFKGIAAYGPEVTREMLDIRPGEALAVNFTFQLHHTPDESVDVNNPRDGLLRMVKGLSPKVTTLVEQESNTNTTPFFSRFLETLEYYSAMFESIEVTRGRDRKDRINVEQHCLAKDIVNIIACEGEERVERHELLGKWRSRLSMAGFRPYPLVSSVNAVIRTLLCSYSDKYTLVEKDGALLLGWKNRNLISASAWH